MSEDKLHLFEICRNAEGHLLAYLSPLDEEGREKSGYRIAGPKAWGGSKSLAKIKISTSDLAVYVNQYAPDVRRMVDSDAPALLDALAKLIANLEDSGYDDEPWLDEARALIAKHRGGV